MKICKLKPGTAVRTNNYIESRTVVDYLKKFNLLNPRELVGNGEGYYGIARDNTIDANSELNKNLFDSFITFDEFINLINQPDNLIVNNFEIY